MIDSECGTTLAEEAVRTGICPICKSPMAPNANRSSSLCSNKNGCSLGVVPKCETYKPLAQAEKSAKTKRELSGFPEAEKLNGKKLFRIIGSEKNWKRIKAVCLKNAKLATRKAETQRSLFGDSLLENSKKFQLGENETIAKTNGKLWIFQETDLFRGEK